MLRALLLLYRHNLRRLFHPVRDNGGKRNWRIVLNHLGLLKTATHGPSTKKRGIMPYVPYLSASLLVSLSWIFRIFPSFWYYLVIVQTISGVVLTAATM